MNPENRHPITQSPHHPITWVSVAALLAVGGMLYARLAAAPPAEVEMAGYATSLEGRTRSQTHNARLAAQALNGCVIKPGRTFSFNRAVRSWSVDRGYVKAPVSFEGELVRAFGGGVCQTSTTLYNAALLAGLPILERHPHVFCPHYVEPGRDAAVAYPGIDLRFKNPYPWPIRIAASAEDGRLVVRLIGSEHPKNDLQITTQVLNSTPPARLTRVVYRPGGTSERAYLRSPGAPGYRVVSYRIFSHNGRELRRERLSDDSYPAMDRVVAVTETEP
jgi:vancomycin resistance protein VanW